VIDGIVPEPEGAAHTDADAASALLQAAVVAHLRELDRLAPERRTRARRDKFRAMGVVA
jgi:acyl-CoA carboxylase subunit beta